MRIVKYASRRTYIDKCHGQTVSAKPWLHVKQKQMSTCCAAVRLTFDRAENWQTAERSHKFWFFYVFSSYEPVYGTDRRTDERAGRVRAHNKTFCNVSYRR